MKVHNPRHLALLLSLCAAAQAAPIYVQTSMTNRWGGNGTYNNPYTSLQKAYENANPGDTIYLKAGVHRPMAQEVLVNRKGTAQAPITIQSESGHWAVLDFADTPAGHSGIVVSATAQYVHIKHLEVRNAKNIGIDLSAYDNRVENCIIHHTQSAGIRVYASYNTIVGNTVYEANRQNRNADGTPGVAGKEQISGIDLYNVAHVTVRGNTVYHVYGEGILFQRSRNITITENTVRDCYSTNYYIDNSRDSWVTNNQSTSNNTTRFYRYGMPANGIMAAIENTGIPPDLRNVTIGWNTVQKANKGFYFWNYNAGSMQSCDINGNSLLTPYNKVIEIMSGAHAGNQVRNNTFDVTTTAAQQILIPSSGFAQSNNTIQ